MIRQYTKNENPASADSVNVGCEPNTGAPPDTLLVHARDISLADIIARHAWLKHDPEYRLKEMPESALTDAERRHLAEQRRRDRRASARFWREAERTQPIGCRIDGFDYDHA
jgi:hypothetical protein